MNATTFRVVEHPPPIRQRRRRQLIVFASGALVVYATAAYIILPRLWKRHARHHPALEESPDLTYTADGIPGDPLNVALIATRNELITTMLAAKWHPADPLSIRSCLRITEATVLSRPYADAPVSNLYLFGRREDLAFEQLVGGNPRHRHHVRFWKTDKVNSDGRPVWIGAATYDKHVGFSRTTGQFTHVTGADIDAERDYLSQCLKQTRRLAEQFVVDHFHQQLHGRNGCGDPWHTDGNLHAAVIAHRLP